MGTQSPGRLCGGDVWQENVQDVAGVQLQEVTGSFLWPLSPVPAGRCPLLGAWGWMSLCVLLSLGLGLWGDAGAAQGENSTPPLPQGTASWTLHGGFYFVGI